MRKGQRPVWAALGLGLILALPAARARAEGDVIRLFNGKDLTGWTIFIRHNPGVKADPRSDPNGVFKVEDGMIHISGQEFGGITTEKAFENYRLTVEFKWGEKKWPPREKDVRDSGIMLHCVGPEMVWPTSIECQIQERDCGDFYPVGEATIEVDGVVYANNRQCVKKKDAEKPTGEWNTVEVVCERDKITNIVNGVVVNQGIHASETKGRIMLQSEGAEVFYRKVELRPLTKAKP